MTLVRASTSHTFEHDKHLVRRFMGRLRNRAEQFTWIVSGLALLKAHTSCQLSSVLAFLVDYAVRNIDLSACALAINCRLAEGVRRIVSLAAWTKILSHFLERSTEPLSRRKSSEAQHG